MRHTLEAKWIASFVLAIMFGVMASVSQAQQQGDPAQQTPAAEQSESLLAGTLSQLEGVPALTVSTTADGGQQYSVTLQILFIMTALTLLPALAMMMTSFTRIIVVFAILRQALGLQQTPSNQILLGLALFLSVFIMSPVFQRVNEEALQPYLAETLSADQALAAAETPFREFMTAQTRESDLALFLDLAQIDNLNSVDEVPMTVLIPAFVTSELKTAFQIGLSLIHI